MKKKQTYFLQLQLISPPTFSSAHFQCKYLKEKKVKKGNFGKKWKQKEKKYKHMNIQLSGDSCCFLLHFFIKFTLGFNKCTGLVCSTALQYLNKQRQLCSVCGVCCFTILRRTFSIVSVCLKVILQHVYWVHLWPMAGYKRRVLFV